MKTQLSDEEWILCGQPVEELVRIHYLEEQHCILETVFENESLLNIIWSYHIIGGTALGRRQKRELEIWNLCDFVKFALKGICQPKKWH